VFARSSSLSVAVVALVLAAATSSQNVPTGFVVESLVPAGLPMPHDLCFTPDGRCLVANQAGEVIVYANGSTATVGVVPDVETSYERGLLSIAADPGFASNGHLYVFYSHTGDAFLHVDRFTCTGALATATSTNLQFAATSRRVVLGTLPDNSTHHNGGALRFGPDGMMYLSCGDDDVPCQAQNIASQAGWLLRFTVGQLPAGGSSTLPSFATLDPGDNPLSTNSDHTQLMLAHGLRNPWRFEIDALSGDIYVGDVGSFIADELSEYVRPATGPLPLRNFGWPWFEGTTASSGCGGSPPAGLVAPIGIVPNAQWVSLLAGPRYRNLGGPLQFGASYEGCLFLADHGSGGVRRLVWTGSWNPAPAVAGQPTVSDWGTGFSGMSSLRQGPDGALWFTRHPGSLARVRPLGPGNTIAAVAGSGQRVSAGEAFPLPLVARVLDSTGAPLANAAVTFVASGAGIVTSSLPVLTDALGMATANVSATTANGGTVTVTATTPGSPTPALFGLFTRHLTGVSSPGSLVLALTNETDAVPNGVPYIMLASFPGSPPLPTPWGTMCIHPAYPLALVIEDAFGLFGGVSFSGTGAIGTPGWTAAYAIPPGLLAGQQLSFQAVGFDSASGLFRTNCAQVSF
jgi:glucose/arabinose dehydrogenase